jgi:pantoate--beta-alanine ligase
MVRDTILGTLAAASSSEVDYVAFVDTETFREVEDLDGGSVLILLAVRFGSTRLIDNIFLPLK